MKKYYFLRTVVLCMAILPSLSKGQALVKPFVHPGLAQNGQDLSYMREKITAGEEPWKSAYDRLVGKTKDFKLEPFTHVVRGSYGHPAVGGSELSSSADEAYSQAIQWYITKDKTHAEKAIRIINAWSARLWDFDDNDAKLLAGWTGHTFCNAAEILRYSGSGWKQSDIRNFQKMLYTAYLPLINGFFPEANGNWDAAMMDTMIAIAVFCDDHALFNKVTDHYLFGEGNGGLTKYIYPSGQCEESTRDQAHVQLGLGELAQTCQIAWSQHVDLYGAAGDRLASGFEYTGRYMLGEDVKAYGIISPKVRGHFNDIYIGIYDHYHNQVGLAMPYTKRCVDSTINRSTIMALTAVRFPSDNHPKKAPALTLNPLQIEQAVSLAGTDGRKTYHVLPGLSIQNALDSCRITGGNVYLSRGKYILKKPLKIYSNTLVIGLGGETVLFLDPEENKGATGFTIINGEDALHDVGLKYFLMEGAVTLTTSSDPNQDRRTRSYQNAPARGGISFTASTTEQMKNICLQDLTIQHCTKNGIIISGATNIVIKNCDISDNGSSVVPGNGLHQNLLITHSTQIELDHNRFDDSPWGNGICFASCRRIKLTNNEVARNATNGILLQDVENVQVSNNLAEGNNKSGVCIVKLFEGCKDIAIAGNTLQYNGQTSVTGYGPKFSLSKTNITVPNRRIK